MKIFIRPRKSILLYIPFVFLFLFAFAFVSNSQSFVGIASVPTDNNAQAGPTPPGVIPPGGMLAGDLVIIYGQYRGNGIPISI